MPDSPFSSAQSARQALAKFAMMMRERGLRDATIGINNEPCLGESGCDALLPDFLPAGASLTVYARDGYKNTYRGKAESE